MKQAYFTYKCRRCGQSYVSPPAISAEKAFVMLTDILGGKEHSDNNTFYGLRKELTEIHICGESGCGVADLKGFYTDELPSPPAPPPKRIINEDNVKIDKK